MYGENPADFTDSTNEDSVARFADSIRSDPAVQFVAPVNVNDAGNAAVVPVIPKDAPQDRSTEQLVHRLRAEIRSAGLHMHVGSLTAIAIDASDHVGERLPFMVAAVIILSFLLLLAVFRSVLVAIKAGIMNLLSIGAAYGVIVAIFQWGWLKDVVGIGRVDLRPDDQLLPVRHNVHQRFAGPDNSADREYRKSDNLPRCRSANLRLL